MASVAPNAAGKSLAPPRPARPDRKVSVLVEDQITTSHADDSLFAVFQANPAPKMAEPAAGQPAAAASAPAAAPDSTPNGVAPAKKPRSVAKNDAAQQQSAGAPSQAPAATGSRLTWGVLGGGPPKPPRARQAPPAAASANASASAARADSSSKKDGGAGSAAAGPAGAPPRPVRNTPPAAVAATASSSSSSSPTTTTTNATKSTADAAAAEPAAPENGGRAPPKLKPKPGAALLALPVRSSPAPGPSPLEARAAARLQSMALSKSLVPWIASTPRGSCSAAVVTASASLTTDTPDSDAMLAASHFVRYTLCWQPPSSAEVDLGETQVTVSNFELVAIASAATVAVPAYVGLSVTFLVSCLGGFLGIDDEDVVLARISAAPAPDTSANLPSTGLFLLSDTTSKRTQLRQFIAELWQHMCVHLVEADRAASEVVAGVPTARYESTKHPNTAPFVQLVTEDLQATMGILFEHDVLLVTGLERFAKLGVADGGAAAVALQPSPAPSPTGSLSGERNAAGAGASGDADELQFGLTFETLSWDERRSVTVATDNNRVLASELKRDVGMALLVMKDPAVLLYARRSLCVVNWAPGTSPASGCPAEIRSACERWLGEADTLRVICPSVPRSFVRTAHATFVTLDTRRDFSLDIIQARRAFTVLGVAVELPAGEQAGRMGWISFLATAAAGISDSRMAAEQAKSAPPPPPVRDKRGMLTKRGVKPSLKPWRSRYCLLDFEYRMLAYYESLASFEAGEPPKGTVDIVNLRDVVPVSTDKKRPHAFDLLPIDEEARVFNFDCESASERDDWIRAIREVMDPDLTPHPEIAIATLLSATTMTVLRAVNVHEWPL